MKVLIIADDEFVIRRIESDPVDVLVSLGDLPEKIILDVADLCQPTHILAVKGNHDDTRPFSSAICDLHLHTATVDGVRFGGFAGSWLFKPGLPNAFEQDEAGQLLKDFPAVDVFLAHNSPRMIHDRDDGTHLGFYAFNNYIQRARPKLFLHGHQHIDEQTLLGSTFIIGTFGHRYLNIATHNVPA